MATSHPGKPRVLLVDDDAKLLLALSLRHQKAFEIVTASSGDQALELMSRNGPFSAVVSDVCMPFMDGFDLARRISEDWPATSIILMSGHDVLETDESDVRQHVFHVLGKPFEKELFETVLTQAVERYQSVSSGRVPID